MIKWLANWFFLLLTSSIASQPFGKRIAIWNLGTTTYTTKHASIQSCRHSYFKDPIGLHYFDSVCFTKTCFLLQSTLIISVIHFDTNMSFPQLQRDGKYMTMLLRISTPAQSPIVVLYNCIEVKKQKQNPKTASLHNKTTLGHFKKLLKSTCTFLMRPCWNFNLSQK